MNYLAHIYLSGADSRLQVGNFIGDAVKGSSYREYPAAISEGILMHRVIDSFTDRHPVIRQAVSVMRPKFGRYSGILLDIYFDHMLAVRFGEFSDVPLKKFSRRFYLSLVRNRRYLPARIKRFMWHFIFTDRLSRYASHQGVRESLEIMVAYHRIDVSVDQAIVYLLEHEEELFAVFKSFFGDLRDFCDEYLSKAGMTGSVH